MTVVDVCACACSPLFVCTPVLLFSFLLQHFSVVVIVGEVGGRPGEGIATPGPSCCRDLYRVLAPPPRVRGRTDNLGSLPFPSFGNPPTSANECNNSMGRFKRTVAGVPSPPHWVTVHALLVGELPTLLCLIGWRSRDKLLNV